MGGVKFGMEEYAKFHTQWDEVAALKKMKRYKAAGLLGLVAEMIQTPWDIGTQWILDLCNSIVKEGCIPDLTSSQVWYYRFTKEKGI